MSWKRNPASSWKLYCIIDSKTVKGKDPVRLARSLLKNGAGAIQLRYKNHPSYKLVPIAKKIQKLVSKSRKSLLIDDRVDVALAAGANGIHLGSGDLSVKTARRLLKPGSIAGKTVHSIKEAKAARFEKIDYIGAGAIFSTPLKKNHKKKGVNFIRKVKRHTTLPVLAIGGINKHNAKKVFESGADGICVTRAALEARELIKNDID